MLLKKNLKTWNKECARNNCQTCRSIFISYQILDIYSYERDIGKNLIEDIGGQVYDKEFEKLILFEEKTLFLILSVKHAYEWSHRHS